jgi:hypothetical protein
MAQIALTAKELRLAAKLLDMAADQFSNHGCNDLPDDAFDGWDEFEKTELAKKFDKYNGGHDAEESGIEIMGDDGLMAFFAAKIQRAED